MLVAGRLSTRQVAPISKASTIDGSIPLDRREKSSRRKDSPLDPLFTVCRPDILGTSRARGAESAYICTSTSSNASSSGSLNEQGGIHDEDDTNDRARAHQPTCVDPGRESRAYVYIQSRQ